MSTNIEILMKKNNYTSNPICAKTNLANSHKADFPLGGILRAERNFCLSFLIGSIREITRQRKITLRAQTSAKWKIGLKSM
jgi:hypothetical protein